MTGKTVAHTRRETIAKVGAEYRGHPDSVEGPKAFVEKRAPRWKD